jgi:hypothetical protein
VNARRECQPGVGSTRLAGAAWNRLFAVNERLNDKGNPMSAQAVSFKEFSLSPVDLIPGDDVDADDPEADARLARYARLAKSVDLEDVVELVLAKLRESTQLACLIQDALDFPHAEVSRPTVHVNELIKMGRQVLQAVAVCVDEQIGLLDVVEGAR